MADPIPTPPISIADLAVAIRTGAPDRLRPPRGELPDAASRIVRVMGSHHGDRPDNRRALLWTASLIAVGAAVVAIAVATGALRLGKSADPAPTAEQLAQQRCQSEVLKRLVSPDNATISELRAEPSTLDVDGRDFSSLTASEPLKGIDTSRIVVLNVSGVANAPSEVGSTISDRFDCRAYFVDGTLAHTLVVFDHAH